MTDDKDMIQPEEDKDGRIAPGAETSGVDADTTPKKNPRAHRGIVSALVTVLCIGLIGISAYVLYANHNAAASSSTPDMNSSSQSTSSNGTTATNPTQSTGTGGTEQAQPTDTTGASTGATTTETTSTQSGGSSGEGSTSSSDNGGNSAQADTVTVHVSVSSDEVGGPVSGNTQATFDPGATAYDALCAVGLGVNASQSQYGVYVSAIGGLAEKEYGGSSGWVFYVNGSEPSISCSSYELSDGDSVSWVYITG